MPDFFKDHTVSLTSPAGFGEAVTPDDAGELSAHSRAIYVGSSGDVALEFIGQPGQTTVLQNLQAGVVYPLRVSKVLATGTTAAGIVCLW